MELSPHTLRVARGGQRIVLEDSAAPLRSARRDTIGVVLVFHDVSEERRLKHELTYQANHDTLTELINRREFEHRLNQALITVRTDKTRHSLLCIDLDQFKVVNDTCGHAAGDELLRQLSPLLAERLRHSDSLGRAA